MGKDSHFDNSRDNSRSSEQVHEPGDREFQQQSENVSQRLQEDAYSAPRAQADCNNKSEKAFHGLNLGIIKIGFQENSFKLGVNVGIAKAGVSLGQETGASGDVNLGPIVKAHAGGGVGFSENGVRVHGGANAKALELAGGGADSSVTLGPNTGFETSVQAKAGPVRTEHGVSFEVGEDGLNTGYQGKAGIPTVLDAGAREFVRLNNDSAAGVEAGVRVGPTYLGSEVSVATDNNTVIRAEVDPIKVKADNEEVKLGVGAQVGPSVDAKVFVASQEKHVDAAGTKHSERNELAFRAGLNGIGLQTKQESDKHRMLKRYGWEPLDM